MTPDSDPPGTLRDLLPSHAPPPALRGRVVRTLRRRGLLREARRRSSAIAWALAAAAAFALGAFAEHARLTAAPATAPSYALLLYDSPPLSPADEATRVDEYRRWARALAARGHLVSGEKLGRTAVDVGPSATPATATAPPLAGFFIVSARSLAEADSIARTHPHVRHGGRIVVRPIDPT